MWRGTGTSDSNVNSSKNWCQFIINEVGRGASHSIFTIHSFTSMAYSNTGIKAPFGSYSRAIVDNTNILVINTLSVLAYYPKTSVIRSQFTPKTLHAVSSVDVKIGSVAWFSII